MVLLNGEPTLLLHLEMQPIEPLPIPFDGEIRDHPGNRQQHIDHRSDIPIRCPGKHVELLDGFKACPIELASMSHPCPAFAHSGIGPSRTSARVGETGDAPCAVSRIPEGASTRNTSAGQKALLWARTSSRGRLTVEFDETDRRQLMGSKRGVLSMQIDDLLPNIWRERMPALLRNRRRWGGG